MRGEDARGRGALHDGGRHGEPTGRGHRLKLRVAPRGEEGRRGRAGPGAVVPDVDVERADGARERRARGEGQAGDREASRLHMCRDCCRVNIATMMHALAPREEIAREVGNGRGQGLACWGAGERSVPAPVGLAAHDADGVAVVRVGTAKGSFWHACTVERGFGHSDLEVV